MCGCVCDDLEVTVQNERIVSISPGCTLAEPWFVGLDSASGHAARCDGETVEQSVAIKRAADVLRNAKSPLVYGLSRSSTPGQRAAVRLADQMGAYIDTTASTCHAPSIMALQVVGESTASLGEIQNRADLVVYWGSNPVISHPRHLERCVDSTGLLIPQGRTDRHVVVIDTSQTETAESADTFIQVQPGRDFELIWALRALLRGQRVDVSCVAGVPLDEIQSLADRLTSCRYGVMFFGLGLTKGHRTNRRDGNQAGELRVNETAHANVEALLRLVTDLNAHTRFVARRMRIPGDVAGADSVLCWQTGFPFSVSLTRGYPRYNPGEYTANNLLERKEVDAVLLVGTEGVSKLSPAAQDELRRIPSIVLEYPTVESPFTPSVEFTTAIYGIHEPGTAYRMDEVPIPLRKVLDSDLSPDHEILSGIAAAMPSTASEPG